jgi:hypothetical protein
MKSFCVKSVVVICFLFTFVFAARARETCVWIERNAPVALNLQLGMTTAEANAVLRGDLKIKLKPKGDYRFFQNYIDKNPPARFRGVRALYLRFFEQKLYQIEVFYEAEFSPALENFAGIAAGQFGFSAAEWTYENGRASVRCGEKTIAADYVLNPRIELTDEAVLDKVIEQYEK